MSSGALCGGDPGDALTRAFLGLAPGGTLPDYGAGWVAGAAPRVGHYFPAGRVSSACWHWERPETWPPLDAEPPNRTCARCRGRWARDQRRAARRTA